MSAIDLDAFRATRLEREPYDHLVVSGFLRPDAVRTIGADYPEISKAGSYPLSELKFGPAFAALIEELRTPEIETAFAEKFDIDLAGRPTMVTVRGQCRAKDGRAQGGPVGRGVVSGLAARRCGMRSRRQMKCTDSN